MFSSGWGGEVFAGNDHCGVRRRNEWLDVQDPWPDGGNWLDRRLRRVPARSDAGAKIAVHDAALVGVMQSAGSLDEQRGGVSAERRTLFLGWIGGALPRRRYGGQRAARDELHGEVVLAFVAADFVDVNDVRMIEPGGGLGFAAEAGDFLRTGKAPGVNQLEGDDAVETELAGAIYLAHAAVAKEFEEFVVAEIVDAAGQHFLQRQAQQAPRALTAGSTGQEQRAAGGAAGRFGRVWLGRVHLLAEPEWPEVVTENLRPSPADHLHQVL